jgi:hypothetical protein
MMLLIGQLACRPFLNKVVSPSQSRAKESGRYWGKPRVGHDDDGISNFVFRRWYCELRFEDGKLLVGMAMIREVVKVLNKKTAT